MTHKTKPTEAKQLETIDGVQLRVTRVSKNHWQVVGLPYVMPMLLIFVDAETSQQAALKASFDTEFMNKCKYMMAKLNAKVRSL